MRIVEVALWHVQVPLPAPFRPAWIPGLPQTENRFTLARLRTASGLQGWSAGAAMARERQGLGDLLGPYLVGERADDLVSVRQRLRELSYLGWHAGWLEPACWDLIGQARGVPVHRLLGSERLPDDARVKLYASTGELRSGPERVVEIEARVSEGFSAAKLRVHAATLKEDIAQIEAVRRAFPDLPMGIDANQGWRVTVIADTPAWTLGRATDFCKAAHDLGYSWVEEPLANDDYEGMAQLRKAVPIAIAGAELNHQGLPECRVMLEKGCLDVYQPDATFAGGIAETWAMARAIAAAGARYTPHTWTNGFGFAVNLHLFAASPWRQDSLLEYPLSPPGWVPAVRDGLLDPPWTHQRGELRLPTEPGLGLHVNARQLRRFGKKFYEAGRIRVAFAAVRDKGLAVAREVGRIRQDRLEARHRDLDRQIGQGLDPLTEFTAPIGLQATPGTGWKAREVAA